MPFICSPPTHFQDLLSKVILLPSLLESFDRSVRVPSETDMSATHDLWLKYVQILDTLEIWEQQYRIGTEGPPFWPNTSQMANTISGNNMAVSFCFRNAEVAIIFVCLWAFRIICTTYIQRLEIIFPDLICEKFSGPIKISTEDVPKGCLPLSVDILRSMEYLLHGMGLCGPLLGLFPFKIAQATINQYNLSTAAYMNLCERITDNYVSRGFARSSLL